MTDDKLIGKTLAGKYLVKRLLGAGGMGAVYEGQHIEIGKRVAIKVITQQSAAHSAEVEARFRREARAASAVESENIVQVFDVGQDADAGLYMVMEFLTGEDLSTRLAREKRVDIGTALVIATQALRGLAKAHAAGVVHRDLKPANIYLLTREDGSLLVKVLDFGISKLNDEAQAAEDAKSSKLTRMGSVIGTPQYMSPEQAQGLATVDHRADVWSFGAVLYECLAGRTAYEEGVTYEQTIIRIVTTRPLPLTEVAPWVPPALAAAVHAALEPDLARRFADCSAFLRALQEAMPQLSADASGRLPSFGGGSNPGLFGGTLPSASSSSRQLVAGAPGSLTGAEMLSSTIAAEPGALDVRRPALTTGSGVVVQGARTGTLLNGEANDDPVAIPGVGGKRSKLVVIGAVFAAAVVGGLAIGGVAVMRSKPAPAQGLVAASAPPPPVTGVAPPPVAPAIAPMPAATEPAPSAKPTTLTPAAVAAAAAFAPAGKPPRPTAAAKPAAAPGKAEGPSSGGTFGGVKVSDEY